MPCFSLKPWLTFWADSPASGVLYVRLTGSAEMFQSNLISSKSEKETL